MKNSQFGKSAFLLTDEIERLYRERAGHYVGLAQWLVGSRAVAEEIVQEVFSQLVARPPQLHNVDAANAYVRHAVVNRSNSRSSDGMPE